jgi:hypothetical protein
MFLNRASADPWGVREFSKSFYFIFNAVFLSVLSFFRHISYLRIGVKDDVILF